MSKTDKTEPRWLAEFRAGIVLHDHINGHCVEETFDDVREIAGGRRHRWNTSHDCARREIVQDACPGHLLCQSARINLKYAISQALQEGNFYALIRLQRHGADRPYLCTSAYWHRRVIIRSDAMCLRCDELAATPTCQRHTTGGYGYTLKLHGGNAPGWYRRGYETVARRATQASLDSARRDYNAYGDTDIEPDPTRHRHSARAYWW